MARRLYFPMKTAIVIVVVSVIIVGVCQGLAGGNSPVLSGVAHQSVGAMDGGSWARQSQPYAPLTYVHAPRSASQRLAAEQETRGGESWKFSEVFRSFPRFSSRTRWIVACQASASLRGPEADEGGREGGREGGEGGEGRGGALPPTLPPTRMEEFIYFHSYIMNVPVTSRVLCISVFSIVPQTLKCSCLYLWCKEQINT